MAQAGTLVVGLTVQKETIAVASVAEEREAAVVFRGTSGTRQCDIDNLLRKRQAQGKPLVMGYSSCKVVRQQTRHFCGIGARLWALRHSLRVRPA